MRCVQGKVRLEKIGIFFSNSASLISSTRNLKLDYKFIIEVYLYWTWIFIFSYFIKYFMMLRKVWSVTRIYFLLGVKERVYGIFELIKI